MRPNNSSRIAQTQVAAASWETVHTYFVEEEQQVVDHIPPVAMVPVVADTAGPSSQIAADRMVAAAVAAGVQNLAAMPHTTAEMLPVAVHILARTAAVGSAPVAGPADG